MNEDGDDRTVPDTATRDAESEDASTAARSDDMPTAAEEAAAERARRAVPDVSHDYADANRRGARQEGEGRIP